MNGTAFATYLLVQDENVRGRESWGQDIENGAPEGIRTPGLCLRRAALYPAELRAQIEQIVQPAFIKEMDN